MKNLMWIFFALCLGCGIATTTDVAPDPVVEEEVFPEVEIIIPPEVQEALDEI
jgi:hypothetical protein